MIKSLDPKKLIGTSSSTAKFLREDGSFSTLPAQTVSTIGNGIYATGAKTYYVNQTTPAVLHGADGSTPFSFNKSYRVRAWTTGTASGTGAEAIFYSDNGTSWNVKNVFERGGNGSNQVNLFINGGIPSIATWHASLYYVNVIVEEISISVGGSGVPWAFLNLSDKNGVLAFKGNKVWDASDFASSKLTNWDAAYTYSQVGHLPLTGGNLSGALSVRHINGRDVGNTTSDALHFNWSNNKDVHVGQANGTGKFFINGKEYDERFSTLYKSRGQQLVTNGTGYFGDNTNFSSFTFDGANSYSAKGGFSTSTYSSHFTNEYIPINASDTYRLSMYAKTVSGTPQKFYCGISPYDIDGNMVDPYTYYGGSYPIITLAQDLKVGDTVVYLTSTDGILDDKGNNHHQHSLVFWGYKNSFGYEYPAGTYSRLTFTTAWLNGAVDRVNKTITFSKPFDRTNPSDAQGVFRAGHKLSSTGSGGTYIYTYYIPALPTEWTRTSETVGPNGRYKLPAGTAQVKLLWLTNYDNLAGTQAISNVEFALDTEHNLNKNTGGDILGPVTVKGALATSGSNAFKVSNSADTEIFRVENNGSAHITGSASIAGSSPLLRLYGANTNQVESGRIRFTEHSTYTTMGAYMFYNGDTNVFSIGANDTISDTSFDLSVIDFNRTSTADINLRRNTAVAGTLTATNLTATTNITATSKLLIGSGTGAGYFRKYTSADTDITGLIGGTTSGTLIKGENLAHIVFKIDANDNNDSFAIIANSTGNDTAADKMLLQIKSGGTSTLNTTLAISKTDEATSITTGALTIAGGLGVAKNLHVGGNIVGVGTLSLTKGVSQFSMNEGSASLTPTITAINTNTGGKAVALVAGTSGGAFIFDSAGFFTIQSEIKANFVGNTVGTGTRHLTIFNDGNTVIGTTTNSGFKFDVNGTSRLNGNTTLGGTLTLGGSITNDVTVSTLAGSNVRNLAVDNTGKIITQDLSTPINWDVFTSAHGSYTLTATGFTCTLSTTASKVFLVTVNGMEQEQSLHYTVDTNATPTKITFPNYQLSSTDKVRVYYFIAPIQAVGNGIASKGEVIGMVSDGNGNFITAGVKGHRSVNNKYQITGWKMIAANSGNITADIKLVTAYPNATSMAGTAKPVITNAQYAEGTTVGWSNTILNAGDIVQFAVDGTTTVTNFQIFLYLQLL
jgi:hypothetical protein